MSKHERKRLLLWLGRSVSLYLLAAGLFAVVVSGLALLWGWCGFSVSYAMRINDSAYYVDTHPMGELRFEIARHPAEVLTMPYGFRMADMSKFIVNMPLDEGVEYWQFGWNPSKRFIHLNTFKSFVAAIVFEAFMVAILVRSWVATKTTQEIGDCPERH